MRKLKSELEKHLGKHQPELHEKCSKDLSFFLLGVEFDYCLVNLYRDGNDYINFHADNEAKDVIASISLGATRR